MAALAGLGVLLRWLAPKVAAISWTTSKEAMSQPLFYLLLTIGIFGLILFPFVPYNTLGEDIKMVKDEGLTLIMVLSILLALWTASVSIADEIEGRTALTVLSKPVGRRQFIIGKFLGILVPVAIMFIVFGALFLASVSFKVVYDAREQSGIEPTLENCRAEMLQVAPGLALAFMETVVLAAISVAISTRLPMLANLMICASIYVLGHLVPVLANSAVGQIEYVGSWPTCWPRSCPCSITSTFPPPSRRATTCRCRILALGRACIASSTPQWPCCWPCCCSRIATWL